MADYISREAAVEAVCRLCNNARPEEEPCGDCLAKVAIMAVPAADVEPVRHGRWMDIWGNYTCSECEYMWEDFGYKTPFCPECGCKMDLEGEK